MSEITKPLLLDETGRLIAQALADLAARTNVDPKEIEAIKDRITALESGAKGMLYIYGNVDAGMDDYNAAGVMAYCGNDYIYVGDTGVAVYLDEAFFKNACTFIDLADISSVNGADFPAGGVYVYVYEGELRLYCDTIEGLKVNGETIDEDRENTFNAPQAVHLSF